MIIAFFWLKLATLCFVNFTNYGNFFEILKVFHTMWKKCGKIPFYPVHTRFYPLHFCHSKSTLINKMAIFLSTYINSVDSKGRVVVPKEFRAILENFHGFVAFRSHKVEAVDCFSMERMEKLSLQIDETLDPFSIDRDSLESAIFADAVTLRFDKDGRISLPEPLIEHAKLSNEVAFVGRGATFQVWNPKNFEQHQKKVRELLGKKGD